MFGVIKKIFGDINERDIKKMLKTVDCINALEPSMVALSNEELRSKKDEYKTRLSQGETLDDLLPEAFATVREAAKRTLGMRHFDVQLIGGIVLHEGRIAEMKTGEGKTLVATLPIYLNALAGRGVHLVTTNDYLASVGSEITGEVYRFLGMTVGVNLSQMAPEQKREAYACDITYGTNNEYGFDYLRDNMVTYQEQMVQRPLYYAIIDEVDSILVDEARTPLIISGKSEKSTEIYNEAQRLVSKLKAEEDYAVDIKMKSVNLTESGVTKVEHGFRIDNLFDHPHITLNHHIMQALKANAIMKKDVDYIVQADEIIIVDEFTGRLMSGRRYSDGLHQAIEAKENVSLQNESMTLATVTFQNYFRMYQKLAGMTGTAKTEEEEFKKIYGLDVVVVPTNRPMIRVDQIDILYKTETEKLFAVVAEIEKRHATQQPVLVGTVSIENSEVLSEMLRKKNIQHEVLNAKQHAQEAEIIALAGQANAVTIATNMAGRGTDILLGGGVDVLGGLHIIGTERHESRRIDNQLRGRSGRQGNPGSSQFYISLEDELIRRFGGDNIGGVLERLGGEDMQPIESRFFGKVVESAQKRVEGGNFDQRKNVLQYDDVMNQQRHIMYNQRKEVLLSENIRGIVLGMVDAVIERIVNTYCADDQVPEDWDIQAVADAANASFLPDGMLDIAKITHKEKSEIVKELQSLVLRLYAARDQQIDEEKMREFEKVIVLRSVDRKWMEHIDAMEQLRQGIHLRSFGGTDPLRDYQFEGFEMFSEMINTIQDEVATNITKAEIETNQEREVVAVANEQTVNRPLKIGRNDACPCNSGKKFKQCHGK
jgi:preprotein translocase subunit SecA